MSELEPVVVDPNDDIMCLVEDIKRCDDNINKIKRQKEVMLQELHDFMCEQEELKTLDTETGEERLVLTWKTSKDSKSLDTARLKAELPAIYKKYFTKVKLGSKRLLIK